MTLGDGVFAYLSTTLSVGDRIYPLTLPQGVVLPAVTYQLVGGEGPLHSHGDAQDGAGPTRPTFQRSRVQLGCWAESARAAAVPAAEVSAAIDGFAGSWGGLAIASALVDISIDDWRPDVGVYRQPREDRRLAPAEVVTYLRSLPSMWADSGPEGRRALATALFAMIEVEGNQRMDELTPEAIELGLSGTLPAILEVNRQIGEFGRGERDSPS